MPAPQTGDVVLYRDPKTGTAGHTGRVRRTLGHRLFVVPAAGGGLVRLEADHVVGYWRKGCRTRTLDRLRVTA